jgi:hypothetical protein
MKKVTTVMPQLVSSPEGSTAPKHLKNQNQTSQSSILERLPRYFLTACFVAIDLALLPTFLKPALAQWNRCPPGYVCLFQGADYNGSYYQFQSGSADFRNLPCDNCSKGDFNDDTSSWFNNSSVKFCMYTAKDYDGIKTPLAPGQYDNYVGDELNDTASSLRKC